MKNEPASKSDDCNPMLYKPMNGTDGLTLRDYFAGHVLAGYAKDHRLHGEFAQHAYEVADAMLQERAKR